MGADRGHGDGGGDCRQCGQVWPCDYIDAAAEIARLMRERDQARVVAATERAIAAGLRHPMTGPLDEVMQLRRADVAANRFPWESLGASQ